MAPMDFDVAVIGGGINGTGIAREAAYQGYRVVLLEKDDFGQATSSQSTKMIHGGIRYLETGDFHLVYESLHERSTLLKIAPHLVRPVRIVIPIYEDSPRSGWMVRLGTILYDLLAGRRSIGRSRRLSRKEIGALTGLRQDGLKSAIQYMDGQVLDGRLCLENALSAEEAGATILNYHPVTGASRIKGGFRLEGQSLRSQSSFSYTARAVINATGPWAPFFERETLGHPTKPMVYDRGIHLVIPSLGLEAGLALMCQDGRLIFILPWEENTTLIGTTESKFEGEDFTRIPPSEEEIEYLLRHFNGFFPARNLTRKEVLHIYSGVRTLVAGQDLALTKLSREADIRVFSEEPGTAWLILYGGKLTSYRALSAQVVKKLGAIVPSSSQVPLGDTAKNPLHGGGELGEVVKPPRFLTPELQQAWQKRYGSRWVDLVAMASENPPLAGMVLERFRFTKADLAYMVTIEKVLTLEDIILRRTKLIYTLLDSEKKALEKELKNALQRAD